MYHLGLGFHWDALLEVCFSAWALCRSFMLVSTSSVVVAFTICFQPFPVWTNLKRMATTWPNERPFFSIDDHPMTLAQWFAEGYTLQPSGSKAESDCCHAAMLPRRLRSLVLIGRRTATCCSRAIAHCAPQRSPNLLLPASSAAWHGELQMDHDGYQRKLATIIKRLKEHLTLQKWPKLTHLELEGRQFKMPIKFKDLGPDFVAKFDAIDDEYLAGFFDGDGCVSATSSLSGCFLQLEQSVQNSRVMFQYLIQYGGSIGRSHFGCGSSLPSIRWRVCGKTAQQAAFFLQRHCLVKKEQLHIAMSWPSCSDQREACNTRLRDLKRMEPRLASDQALSWTYLAGFFDAEGCISMDRASTTIRLDIWQRDAAILKVIQGYLCGQFPSQDFAIKMYSSVGGHSLVSSRRSTSTLILKSLLDHGLQSKRQTAMHALSAPNAPHSKLRQDLAVGKGKQSYFERLDEDGCARARKIKQINAKLRYTKGRGQVVADELRAGLEFAKLEHKVLTAQSQILKLRSFIAFVRKMKTSPSLMPREFDSAQFRSQDQSASGQGKDMKRCRAWP